MPQHLGIRDDIECFQNRQRTHDAPDRLSPVNCKHPDNKHMTQPPHPLSRINPALASSRSGPESPAPLAFEHLRLNVADKDATARWYAANADLEILPSTQAEMVYVADKDHNFMFEFSSIKGRKTNYADIPIDGFHIAFDGHPAIEAVGEKMLANGGQPEGAPGRTAIGDYLLNVRDPNGLTVQLLHRKNPFYAKAVKGHLRFEHFAYNIPDQKTAALWYIEFMGLVLPWSKDMETKANNFRNYRVPYVGDLSRNMSIELYSKPELAFSLAGMSHEECHIAYRTDDPEAWAKRMVFGGAKQISTRTEANGDVEVDLFEPYQIPIRLSKRSQSILEA